MSQANLAIRNAKIVDGTGASAFQGDVAVADGKILAVGKFDGTAAKEINAGGHVLSPGFIDIHTHFDPQLCWDRLATPSLEHGVTTVVVGNCSLASPPCTKAPAASWSRCSAKSRTSRSRPSMPAYRSNGR